MNISKEQHTNEKASFAGSGCCDGAVYGVCRCRRSAPLKTGLSIVTTLKSTDAGKVEYDDGVIHDCKIDSIGAITSDVAASATISVGEFTEIINKAMK